MFENQLLRSSTMQSHFEVVCKRSKEFVLPMGWFPLNGLNEHNECDFVLQCCFASCRTKTNFHLCPSVNGPFGATKAPNFMGHMKKVQQDQSASDFQQTTMQYSVCLKDQAKWVLAWNDTNFQEPKVCLMFWIFILHFEWMLQIHKWIP